jgi:hypothetical protein
MLPAAIPIQESPLRQNKQRSLTGAVAAAGTVRPVKAAAAAASCATLHRPQGTFIKTSKGMTEESLGHCFATIDEAITWCVVQEIAEVLLLHTPPTAATTIHTPSTGVDVYCM